MQKVEGSNPFSRLSNPRLKAGIRRFGGRLCGAVDFAMPAG